MTWIQEMPQAPLEKEPMSLLVNSRGRVVEVPERRVEALLAKGFVEAPKGAKKRDYLKSFDSAVKVEEKLVKNEAPKAPAKPRKKTTSKKK